MGSVESDSLAPAFKALGDPTRLRIFQFLRDCCGPVAVGEEGEVRPVQGPTVGEVCCHVLGTEKIPSSLSFHLKELRLAGLISMERRGKNMICSIEPDAVTRLADFFAPKPDDCC